MHIHILGVCGTFMGGIAQIARSLGHRVTGSDENVYPPMSDQLTELGITVLPGYKPEQLQPAPDHIIIGNTLSRGNTALEYVLSNRLDYSSGPEWLYQNVLKDKHVLAVSGTHGKTTTTAILSWIMESARLKPGFLLGGVAENFGKSARYTDSEYFVIEADEYDTVFSDKRSKFIHYHPETLIINNIEFDHADIFHDLASIRREFHHLLRTLPKQACIIFPQRDPEIKKVLAMGCWSETVTIAAADAKWFISDADKDFREFAVNLDGAIRGKVRWPLIGEHNANNALAAIAAVAAIGVSPELACRSLSGFKSVKRRLECILDINGVRLYDDFAHHPTAIAATLKALRRFAGKDRVIAVMEPRSNTMRMGIHAKTLVSSLQDADHILIYQADNIDWEIADYTVKLGARCQVFKDIPSIVGKIGGLYRSGDHIVIMSNGGFGNIREQLIEVLS